MGSTVTIGVNLCWLVPGVVGGSEEYATRLLRHLAPLLDDDRRGDDRANRALRVRLYARPELVDAHPELADHYPVIPMPGRRGAGVATRIGAEHTWLAAASRGDDVVHHFGGTVPLVRSVPALVTIHDLQPLDHPEHFHPVKRAWLGRMVPYAVRAARVVLCPSRFTADRIQARYGVADDRLRVVPHGLDPRSPPRSATPDAGAGVAGHVGADVTRYVLYPAIAYAHKRHVDLIRALARRDPGLDDIHVVLTGRPGPELPSVLAEARRSGVADRVHVLGRIPAADLETLYRGAAALVFPSAYEGFGNPALEAMALDCPVVASDAGALPEVVGDAGLVVPTGDVPALASAMSELITRPELADELRRRGRRRVAEWSAERTARRLHAVYHDATSPGHRTGP